MLHFERVGGGLEVGAANAGVIGEEERAAVGDEGKASHEQFATFAKTAAHYRHDANAGCGCIERLLVEQLERFDEAFKFLFKANYLLPDGAMTERALAWCSLLTKKYEQAETYYAKVLAHEPTAADYLNAGHAAWLQGKVALAVERYRKATADSPSEGDFLQDDLPLLREAGLTDIEIALMRDAVAQTHP